MCLISEIDKTHSNQWIQKNIFANTSSQSNRNVTLILQAEWKSNIFFTFLFLHFYFPIPYSQKGYL